MSDGRKMVKEMIDQVSETAFDVEGSVVTTLRSVFESDQIVDLKKSELTQLAQSLIELQTKAPEIQDEK